MANLSVSSIWQKAKLREKLIIVVGLFYIISPIDILPEIILGPLGLLDDGGALLAVVYTVVAVLNRQKQAKANVIEGEEVEH